MLTACATLACGTASMVFRLKSEIDPACLKVRKRGSISAEGFGMG
jgi:hypothetical protein